MVVIGFALVIGMYCTLYAFTLRKGLAMSVEIDMRGTRTMRAHPSYHRPQFLGPEWADNISQAFAPIHYADKIVRPKRWPKDQVTVLSPEEMQEIADEIAADEALENRS
ncbi:MAG: hypothetical protein H7062_02590 [Candidatus Saccharimonas sp.]|nr:hypothetical protein [Planctomycetaceae bacterium]